MKFQKELLTKNFLGMVRSVRRFFFIFCTITVVYCSSCGSSNAPSPSSNQAIINFDTSSITGRLKVYIFDYQLQNIPNADVYLYSRYDDIILGLHVLKLKSNSNALADFGYVN